jgi:aerobic-type carbon monoxide dehydrogenase small subunit (CoxS/CutS family)
MQAAALLALNPKPTEAEIVEAMKDNLCRCAAYLRIKRAIKRAAYGLA